MSRRENLGVVPTAWWFLRDPTDLAFPQLRLRPLVTHLGVQIIQEFFFCITWGPSTKLEHTIRSIRSGHGGTTLVKRRSSTGPSFQSSSGAPAPCKPVNNEGREARPLGRKGLNLYSTATQPPGKCDLGSTQRILIGLSKCTSWRWGVMPASFSSWRHLLADGGLPEELSE